MLIKETAIIEQPVAVVYEYMKDFSQIYEWDSQVIESSRIDLGPIEIGSQFLVFYSFLGQAKSLNYTITHLIQDSYIELECRNENFNAKDCLTFKTHATGTMLTYEVIINLKFKASEFFIKPILIKNGKEVVNRIQSALDKNRSNDFPTESLHLGQIPIRFSSLGWIKAKKNFYATTPQSKVVLITGPTSGLGRSCSLHLAGKGCQLILLGRNQEKLNGMISELKERNYRFKIKTYLCDLENLDSLAHTCNLITQENSQIDVVINNAGALFPNEKKINGIERSTVVNLIAPWIISCKLLKSIPTGGCIIQVSSGGMYSCRLNLNQLIKAAKPFSGAKAYALAKRAMVVFSEGLNQELTPLGVSVHCMHPGWAKTPGVINSLPGFYNLTRKFLRTPFQGAETICWLALTNPDKRGRFWLDRKPQPTHISKQTKSSDHEYQALKELLIDLTGLDSTARRE